MKAKLFFSICIFLFGIGSEAQTWNLPARSASAMNGTQFVAAINSLSFTARENLILQEILAGNVPSFYRNLKAVTSYGTVSGVTDSVTYYVTYDYLAVGHDTDYFLCPMSPIVATKIGDSTGCTLPTRKMVNDIYSSADLKLAPLPIAASGTMTTVAAFRQHDTMVWNQRSGYLTSYPLGTLVGGDKKDVVISNIIYNTSGRVVIYGWHQSVGNPIQPMSNVHSDTYMDYSHGMRLIQNAVTYHGNATTVKAILQSSTQNPLLSDEGTIGQPQYPYSNVVTSLSTPISFALINNLSGGLDIKVSADANATHYKVYTSTDGTNFGAAQTLVKTSLTLTGLTAGQIYFVKIAAFNQPNTVTSATSELLAAVPSVLQDSVLIVNGFDRPSTGNTYNFVIQHGNSLRNKGFGFSSASNEAVQNSLVNLSTYKSVDWILGEESSTNESFSTTEQTKIQNYLDAGGFLFTSGSEIGWDLDNLGSTADKSFYNNYLKADYVMDAPNNQSSTWYTCNAIISGIFNFSGTLQFDNGSNGTYNVDYPDVITPLNGSSAAMQFTSSATDYSGVYFSGNFPGGTTSGKLVYLTFPFETIYPSAMRDSVMGDVMNYFFPLTTTSVFQHDAKNNYTLYPNPTNSVVAISFGGENIISKVEVYDLGGRKIISVSNDTNKMEIDLKDFPSGIYYAVITTDAQVFTKKIVRE
jgi:hypothetical protein